MTEYPDDWDQRRQSVYERDNYECQNCGAKGGPRGNTTLHAHHIVPKSSGGRHEETNLTTVCEDCHKAIHNDVDAPTANQVVSASSSSNLSELIFSLKISQAFPRVFSRDEEEEYIPPSPPVGLYFYSCSIYYDCYADVLSFTVKQEPLPDELYRRYTISRRICLGLLGETKDIVDYEGQFKTLIDYVKRSQQPPDKVADFISEVNADTLHGALDELEEYERADAPQSYTQYLDLSRKLFDVLRERFFIYDQRIEITDSRVPTLAASAETEWKRRELDEELTEIVPKWEDTTNEVGEEALRVANKKGKGSSEGCFIATAATGVAQLREGEYPPYVSRSGSEAILAWTSVYLVLLHGQSADCRLDTRV